jgi:hypothetical protein
MLIQLLRDRVITKTKWVIYQNFWKLYQNSLATRHDKCYIITIFIKQHNVTEDMQIEMEDRSQ